MSLSFVKSVGYLKLNYSLNIIVSCRYDITAHLFERRQCAESTQLHSSMPDQLPAKAADFEGSTIAHSLLVLHKVM